MKGFFLNPDQVKIMIMLAEHEDDVIVVRCVRKTSASKPGGPNSGQLYDLHCTKKPSRYRSARKSRRNKEDAMNGILTVYVTNRKDPDTGLPGAWRRVNISHVQKVIYRTKEFEVITR